MRTAVFGATGRTVQPFVEQALDRGVKQMLDRRHEAVALVRDPTGLRSTVRNDDRVSAFEGNLYVHEMPKIADA